MTTSIIRAGGTGVPGVQTTGGDDGALALKVGPLAATVEALSITTAGSVGIGTASPAALFHVSGASVPGIITSSDNALVLKLQQSSSSTAYIGTDNNSLVLAPSTGTVGATLTATGLGLGTASPATLLEIASPASTATVFRLASNKTGSGAGDKCRWDNYSANNSGVAYQLGFIDFDRSDATATASYMAIQTRVAGTVAERMRIDSAGNVGIGTSSISGKLSVDGGVYVAAGSASGVAYGFYPAGTYGNTGMFSPAANTVAFATAGGERMRIDSAGKIGFGATPGAPFDFRTGLAANSQFTINASTTAGSGAGGAFLKFHGSNAASAPQIAGIDGSMTNGTDGSESGILAFFTTNSGTSAEKMRITSTGNVLVGTTANIAANAKIFAQGSGVGIAVGYGTGSSEYRHFYMNSGDANLYVFNNTNYGVFSSAGAWTNASDRRIKKNIVDIKYGLADVLKIQPRSYQMKEVAGDYIGLIAQEMEEIIPEVVSGDPEKQLTLDYGSLVAVAFKAIQEQQVIIESLKTRITALEG